MKMVPLGDVITAAGPRSKGDLDLPVYSVTKHSGFVPSLEYFKKQVFSRETAGYRIVEPGEFSYATIHLDEGSIGVAPERALISPMYTVFKADPRYVFTPYLLRFLKSPRALASYEFMGSGAVHRRKAISLQKLSSMNVPLPSVEEQRRIASILDQADTLRTQRRTQLAHLDTLPQAIFHEMFGDPLATTNNRTRLGDIAEIMTGNSPSRTNPENFGTGIDWIKSDNLGSTFTTPAHEQLTVIGSKRARIAPSGSILITCIAGSRTSIGKCSINEDSVSFNQQINAILPSENFDSMFMLWQIKSCPELVRSASTGGMKGLVSKSSLAAIRVLNPPMDQQQEFASYVARCLRTRGALRRQATSADDLFASLQSRAFRGEL